MMPGPIRPIVLVCSLPVIACSTPVADPDLAYHRGLTALSGGRADLAAEYFAADLETHSERAESMRGLATAWLAMANPRLGDAARVLERYLALRPDDAEVQLMLVGALFHDGATQEARERLQFMDQSVNAHHWRMKVLLNEDVDAASAAAERALEVYPDDPGLLELAATIEAEKGAHERAWELGRRAAERGNTRPELYYLLLRLARATRRLDSVADLVRVHENLGKLVLAQAPGQLPPADRLELLAGLQGPLPADALWLRVQRALALIEGKDSEAAAELERLRGEPELTDDARVQLATFALVAAMVPSAQALFEDMAEDGPYAELALNGRAQISLTAGRFDEVERLARAGLQREPHSGGYHHLLAVALIEMEQLEQAEPPLSRAVALAPWQPEWRLRLLDLLIALGRRAQARQVLAQAPYKTPALTEFERLHRLTAGAGDAPEQPAPRRTR